MSKWKFGGYLRLSSEDKIKLNEGDVSYSIENQEGLVTMYLENEKDTKIYNFYIDDGYTGTDFNRPGFQEMIDDIYARKINAIIVKDLSRLGRNYIAVGEFIDEVIVKYNIRFISINDDIDSYLKPDSMSSIEVYIKNLMNEGYAKDTSKKLRSTHKTSKKNGKYIGIIAPYGYIKDKEDCHKFVLDYGSAEVISRIFNFALLGKSKQEIVEELNNTNTLTPSQYFRDILKYKRGRVSTKWNVQMVDEILKNETYIGSLVQGKRQRISHKTHNIIRVAEEDWIIVKNHHKPIIKESIFYQVQNILYNRNTKISYNGKFAPYSGYIKCNDCNCNLHRKVKKKNNLIYYYCGTYLSNKGCTKHYITENEINDVVLASINMYIDLLSDLKQKVDTISVSKVEYNNDVKNAKILTLTKDIDKQEKLIEELKNDYKNDLLSKEDFEDFHKQYMYELNSLRLSKEELENEKDNKFNLDWLKEIKKLNKINTITRNVVDEFIQNIYVCEDKNIKIEFKYKDQYEEAIRYLKSQKSMI